MSLITDISVLSFPAVQGSHTETYKIGRVRRLDIVPDSSGKQFIRVFQEHTDDMQAPPESCTFVITRSGTLHLVNPGGFIGSARDNGGGIWFVYSNCHSEGGNPIQNQGT